MSEFMNIDDQPELTEQYLNDVFPDIFKKFPNLDYGMFYPFNKLYLILCFFRKIVIII